MIQASIIADSITDNGIRLITAQLHYPRFIHSEVLTHRVFSRNAASSRAIPIQKMIDQVGATPAMPVYWGKNQPGMQAREELEHHEPKAQQFYDGHRNDYFTVYSPRDLAIKEWLAARDSAVGHAKTLVKLGAHKQIVNRLLEPWQTMQTVVTSTEWTNWNALRRHVDAQPEIKALADTLFEAVSASKPKYLQMGQWHLPYVNIVDQGRDEAKKLSTARCARVSYLNHNQTMPDEAKDLNLHDKLLESGHFSPFEHQATPMPDSEFYANFKGWMQYRYVLGF